MSESSFTWPGLRASGLVRRLRIFQTLPHPAPLPHFGKEEGMEM
jgi:hypothetical protein